jgi:hypothetical protein
MENGYQCSRTGKRAFKYSLGPEDGHVPSKLESKIIRKLCAKSGMTKEEVLSVKENRIFIAEELKRRKGGRRITMTDEMKDVGNLPESYQDSPITIR